MWIEARSGITGLSYVNNCVSWPARDVWAEGGLADMVNGALRVSRRTFLRHVNRESLSGIEASLGYEKHPMQGMTMAGDYAVSYYRSKLHGKTVYFLTHSAIEYVFT